MAEKKSLVAKMVADTWTTLEEYPYIVGDGPLSPLSPLSPLTSSSSLLLLSFPPTSHAPRT
eukprot:1071838-Rhodomonas_salina.3